MFTDEQLQFLISDKTLSAQEDWSQLEKYNYFRVRFPENQVIFTPSLLTRVYMYFGVKTKNADDTPTNIVELDTTPI